MFAIDINCDMGEYDSADGCQADVAFMPHISRCNIAVGGHIGNADTIRVSFENAAQHNLNIGIHPSYPDREGFGRQRNHLSNADVVDSLRNQIELGLRVATELGIELSHIKCHGALYNDLETDYDLALSVANLFSCYPLAVMGMAHGQFAEQCQAKGRPFIHEAFMDRRYLDANHLQPRSETGSVLTDTEQVINQAIAIARHDAINTASGHRVNVKADSICVHSDTDGALELVQAVRQRFCQEDIHVATKI